VYDKLPFCIRVLLESVVRNCDNFQIHESDAVKVLGWKENQNASMEVPFCPARVILQDFTGVPAVVDFAAMRDAVARLGGDPTAVNPVCPVDLVVDHSVQVDFTRSPDSVEKNQQLEFERNKERFMFLKWGAQAFSNTTIVPPGSGIVHQVNLEQLARVVFRNNGLLYPDTVVGTDSHTTMINGLGVLGWGVGGIEAEAVMLGQAISMVLPKVVGYRITGSLDPLVTSTDVVLTITKHLRQIGVVGQFVEFFGPGVTALTLADRATVSNMCPEYGATAAFFPVDTASTGYLRQTGRSEEHIAAIEHYLRAVRMFRDYSDPAQDPVYSQIVSLDLATVVPSCSGPKRPQDRVAVSDMTQDFRKCLTAPVSFKGFGLTPEAAQKTVPLTYEGNTYTLTHGSVVMAAITSCTNTSNPSVMLGAGLLAQAAVARGLTVKPYIKTSLSPGSGVVTHYLRHSGVLPALAQLGFDVVGYGCMTCIGNSGPLAEGVQAAIEEGELVCAGVLSGNRNFEGRIHSHIRANYLASPLLVIAYALAGSLEVDLSTQPLGVDPNGVPVMLQDIWPTRAVIREVEERCVLPQMFREVYANMSTGSASWQALKCPADAQYPWDEQSTYIRNPPYFTTMTTAVPDIDRSVTGGRCLLLLGDSVTTDHISPAGSIARASPAARYLAERGLAPRLFNSYGSRRGNDEVMARGTFANIRIVNKMVGKPGPKAVHQPSQEVMDVHDCAARYAGTGTPLIVVAGKEYGSGSSRDWAAKGPYLLGVRAIIAESYERIHRSNLLGMGVLPLEFAAGETAESLGLTGKETFDVLLPSALTAGFAATVKVNGGEKSFTALARLDTEVEVEYYRHGGILMYMVRKMVQ